MGLSDALWEYVYLGCFGIEWTTNTRCDDVIRSVISPWFLQLATALLYAVYRCSRICVITAVDLVQDLRGRMHGWMGLSFWTTVGKRKRRGYCKHPYVCRVTVWWDEMPYRPIKPWKWILQRARGAIVRLIHCLHQFALAPNCCGCGLLCSRTSVQLAWSHVLQGWVCYSVSVWVMDVVYSWCGLSHCRDLARQGARCCWPGVVQSLLQGTSSVETCSKSAADLSSCPVGLCVCGR